MLLTGDATRNERATFHLQPYAFINVPNSRAEQDAVSQSYFNQPEAQCIIALVRFLTGQAGIHLQSIGIITPYQQQLKLIKRHFGAQLDIATVDGFQGREKDVILLSTVRAHSDKAIRPTIGFVSDRRRLNVALTRGKYAVYVIGHATSLSIDQNWNSLVQDAKARRCMFDYRSQHSFHWLTSV